MSVVNYPEIMGIPLFIKAPGQEQGERIDRNAETVDILPTILDILEVETSWEMDGQSVLDSQEPERPQKLAFLEKGQKIVLDPHVTRRGDHLQRKIDLFGSGDLKKLFQIGSHPQLLGEFVRALSVLGGPESLSFEISGREFFSNVALDSGFLLANITGRISGVENGGCSQRIAIAVNGQVRAISQTSPSVDRDGKFTALVPWWSFCKGRNLVEAFLVSERDGNPQLIRGKETRAENYRLLCTGGSGCILSYGSGESIPLVEDRILGWVVGGISEMSDHFRLGGWVVDKKNLRLVKEVVAFEGERLIASGVPTSSVLMPLRCLRRPIWRRADSSLNSVWIATRRRPWRRFEFLVFPRRAWLESFIILRIPRIGHFPLLPAVTNRGILSARFDGEAVKQHCLPSYSEIESF